MECADPVVGPVALIVKMSNSANAMNKPNTRTIQITLVAPSYSEQTLFLSAWAVMVLFLLNDSTLVQWTDGGYAVMLTSFLILALVPGLLLALFHAVVRGEKSNVQKDLMALFVVLLNLIIGSMALIALMQDAKGWMLVFPLWNFINVVWLLCILWVAQGKDLVDDTEMGGRELLLGAIVVMGVVMIFEYLFHATWPVTLAATLGYATSLNRLVQRLWYDPVLT